VSYEYGKAHYHRRVTARVALFGLNFEILGVDLLDQMFLVQNPEDPKKERKKKNLKI